MSTRVFRIFGLLAGLLAFFFVVTSIVVAGPRWPWPRRVNKHVETFHITAHKKTPVEMWPKEPPLPQKVNSIKFAQAFRILCQSSHERIDRYSSWIIEDATKCQIDPFLLAALIYDQSGCNPIAEKRYVKRGLYSLTHFSPTMHQRSVKKNVYTYYTKDSAGWHQQTIKLEYPLNEWKARAPRTNVYLAAATLRVFNEQFPMLQEEFIWHPYRHYISNWFFGDWVKNPEPENRVLTARRRLLHYYHEFDVVEAGSYRGVALVSPLDGVPRLVIDYFKNKRGKKDGFGHRGIDIDGTIGEPVRAVAAGRVVFAGIDLPGGGEHRLLSPDESKEFSPQELPQGGGFYVAINHGNHFGTAYMHLDSYSVQYNQHVEAGDIIGALGQSGSKKSGPHLHIEFRQEAMRVDPAKYFGRVLVNPYKNL